MCCNARVIICFGYGDETMPFYIDTRSRYAKVGITDVGTSDLILVLILIAIGIVNMKNNLMWFQIVFLSFCGSFFT